MEKTEIYSKSIRTFGYLLAYGTMIFYDCKRIQGQKKPTGNYDYYFMEKMGSFVSKVDSIGWDNFKKVIQNLSLVELFDTHYLGIGLGGVPTLGLDNSVFNHEYLEGQMTKEEFLSTIK